MLVPEGPRSCYFFFTLVRTDVMMHNSAAEVSSTAVRGGSNRLLMTPWTACQNPSWYKNRKALTQAANLTRENFAAVPTRTNDAPVWVQAQKMQSLRWKDCIVKPRRVYRVVFASLLATTMQMGVNRHFKKLFSIAKDSNTLKKYWPAQNLKKAKLPTY